MITPDRAGGWRPTVTNWNGAEYRRVSSLQEWLADRALDGVDLTGAGSVLDIGCGDGRITAQLADRLPDAVVVGIDPSPGMLAVAPSGRRIGFCLADATRLPFHEAFDVVVSFNALHWVMDQAGALRQVASALHPCGRAFLVLVCAGPRPSLEHVAMDVTVAPAWRSDFAGFSAPFRHPDPRTYQDLAEAAGCRVVDLRVDDLSWDFGSAEEFRRWATVGFDAWTSRLPAGATEAFMTDVMTAYRAVTGSPSTFRFMQLTTHLTRAG